MSIPGMEILSRGFFASIYIPCSVSQGYGYGLLPLRCLIQLIPDLPFGSTYLANLGLGEMT